MRKECYDAMAKEALERLAALPEEKVTEETNIWSEKPPVWKLTMKMNVSFKSRLS